MRPAGHRDFQQIENKLLDFENTRRSQAFTVTIFDDDIPEGTEELNVTLSLENPNLANQVMVEPAVATVRIRDNDGKSNCFLVVAMAISWLPWQLSGCHGNFLVAMVTSWVV